MQILRTHTRSWAFLIIALTAVASLLTYLRTNLVFLLVLNAYANRFPSDVSMDMLRYALLLNCYQSSAEHCKLAVSNSDEVVLRLANEHFLKDLGSMQIITDSTALPAELFTMYGISELVASADEDESVSVLFGPGYLQLRTFLFAENESCWQFAVQAKHDDPAPVELVIWLDDIQLGTLFFAKGDQSWDTLSVYAPVRPNSHWLRIYFANDYLDKQTGADRNAYIKSVTVNRVEEARCESQ